MYCVSPRIAILRSCQRRGTCDSRPRHLVDVRHSALGVGATASTRQNGPKRKKRTYHTHLKKYCSRHISHRRATPRPTFSISRPHLKRNRQVRPRRRKVIPILPLVRPRVPPLLHPHPEPLEERTDEHPHLLQRERLPDAVHRPERERQEARLVVPERGVGRGHAARGGELPGGEEPALGPELGRVGREVARVVVVRVDVRPEDRAWGKDTGLRRGESAKGSDYGKETER